MSFVKRFSGRISIVDARGRPQGAGVNAWHASRDNAAARAAPSEMNAEMMTVSSHLCVCNCSDIDAGTGAAIDGNDGALLAVGVNLLRAVSAEQLLPIVALEAARDAQNSAPQRIPNCLQHLRAGSLAGSSPVMHKQGDIRWRRPGAGPLSQHELRRPLHQELASACAVITDNVDSGSRGYNIAHTRSTGDEANVDSLGCVSSRAAPVVLFSRTRHVSYKPASMNSYRRLMETLGTPLPSAGSAPQWLTSSAVGHPAVATADTTGRHGTALVGLTPAQAAALCTLLDRRIAREKAMAYGSTACRERGAQRRADATTPLLNKPKQSATLSGAERPNSGEDLSDGTVPSAPWIATCSSSDFNGGGGGVEGSGGARSGGGRGTCDVLTVDEARCSDEVEGGAAVRVPAPRLGQRTTFRAADVVPSLRWSSHRA